MKRLEDVIRRLVVSEKTTMLGRDGVTYVFAVDLKANKQEIAEAVSTLFGVKVVSVHTLIMPGKSKRYGRTSYMTHKWKKAVVKLAEGQKIDLFDDVAVGAAEAAEA